MVISGDLTFVSSATFQQCRYNFINCEFQSNVVFPTAVNGTSPFIHFFDCTFSNVAAMTLPNTTCTIVFTRCVFNNQVIGILAPYGYITFRDCTNMNSLSLPAIYSGVNALVNRTSALVASTVTANSISLGGASTSFLMGNGGLNIATYTTMVSNTFSASWGVTPNVVSGTFTYSYIFNGTTKIVTLGVPHIRTAITGGPFFTFSATTNALPAVIRPVGECVLSIRLVENNVFLYGSIALYSTGAIGFHKLTQWTNNANQNGSGCSTPGDYIYVTYVV